MCLHNQFGHLHTSYNQKKGWESNWQFDSRPLKIRNHPDFLACRWCTTYCWKALDEGYNFAWDLISIRSLHAKLLGPKIVGIPIVGISKLPFGSLRTNWHLSVGPMARHIIYYKGEGGGFPPSLGHDESWESMFTHGSFVHQNASTMH